MPNGSCVPPALAKPVAPDEGKALMDPSGQFAEHLGRLCRSIVRQLGRVAGVDPLSAVIRGANVAGPPPGRVSGDDQPVRVALPGAAG